MNNEDMTPVERRQLGCARAQHAVFDAIYALWEERQEEGLTKQAIAEFLGRDPGWVSRTMSGPGNWTLRTFGELVEALDGYIDVKVIAREKLRKKNYDIYADILDNSTLKAGIVGTYRPDHEVTIAARTSNFSDMNNRSSTAYQETEKSLSLLTVSI